MPNFDHRETVELLKQKLSICAYSGSEDNASDFLEQYLRSKGIAAFRVGNNVCAYAKHNKKGQKTVLINSHIDTVKASESYSFDPFKPFEKDGKLYGLGSNDAGGALVSFIQTFINLYEVELPYNLLLILSSEEENSGSKGLGLALEQVDSIDMALIGEPTLMKVAIGERGLLVVDGMAHGEVGHAARNEGDNAIFHAIEDILYIQNFEFDKVSPLMGKVNKNVTVIQGGWQHNVIPDRCSFVVDIRPNEYYTNQEIVEILQRGVKSELKARSLKNECSFTPSNHTLIQCVQALGMETYISPTTSDWMRLSCPAIKIGPGNSERSHSADEFIYVQEIADGIAGYTNILMKLTTRSYA
ncbi:acetylornithine deacetylase [Bacteroidia bacterium]|nr:acetylornithine deacetylase [Bacteroidia bacterium]